MVVRRCSHVSNHKICLALYGLIFLKKIYLFFPIAISQAQYEPPVLIAAL